MSQSLGNAFAWRSNFSQLEINLQNTFTHLWSNFCGCTSSNLEVFILGSTQCPITHSQCRNCIQAACTAQQNKHTDTVYVAQTWNAPVVGTACCWSTHIDLCLYSLCMVSSDTCMWLHSVIHLKLHEKQEVIRTLPTPPLPSQSGVDKVIDWINLELI